MTRLFIAYGPFTEGDAALAAGAAAAGGSFRVASSMVELGLPHMPRPAAIVLRLDAAELDDFMAAVHNHPKLEGVPLLCVLPQLTKSAAIRATALGADDFLAVADLGAQLPVKLTAAVRDPVEPPPPRRCKVLILDSSPLHAGVLQRLLGRAGFETMSAQTCAETLALLESPAGFGLLILDLGMPDGDAAGILPAAAQKLGPAMPPAIAMIHAGVPTEVSAAAIPQGFRHLHDKRRAPDELLFLAHEASVQDHSKSRASPRLLCAVLVGFRLEGGRWEYGLSYNLSLSGLFVRTMDPPPQDSVLDLELTPPGWDALVAARARVAWRKDFSQRASRSSPTGMGLQIIEPSDQVQRAMATALRHLASRPGR